MADKFTERDNYILDNSINIEWFLEAINKNNPLHPEEGAAHTESYELDGQNILVPRVRIKDGKAIVNKENALEEALEKGDYIVVPEGEDPDQYSKDLSKLIGKFRGFNKGGTPMEKQMNLFEEGGLKEEGGMVDEESGNDVPTGSTREEVRDDIPAMLSEGEFVFPADVVRYHGLEKLMELRQEAKMGIKKMEAMGQMGNADEATLPDDIPFTVDDLIIVAEPIEQEDKDTKKKAHGGVLHAAAGTYVAPSTGVIGTQESIYANQPLSGAPTIPISGQPANFTQPVSAPVGGYTPLFVGAPTTTTPAPTTTPTTPFVPTVEDAYTTVKYIDPNTGATIDINFYQGKPVQAIPAGYIPKSEYDAGNTGTGDGTGTTGQTGVATTQVTAKDEGIVSQQDLTKMREDAARIESKERNDFLNKSEFEETDKDRLKNMWMNTRTAQAVSTGVGILGAGVVGLAGGLAARREQKKVEDALTLAYGNEDWKKEDWAQESAIKSGFQQIKDDAAKSFTQTFTKAGRQEFYDTYGTAEKPSKYDPSDLFNVGTKEGAKPYTVVEKRVRDEEGNTVSMPKATGNLTVREQQAFDNAVDSGNDAVAQHYAIIANRSAKIDAYARGESVSGLSQYDIAEAEKYGSSRTTAINEGRAVENKNPFGKTRLVEGNDNPADDGPAGSKDSDKTESSCVIATHGVSTGGFSLMEKAKAELWCERTYHGKWYGEAFRRGYRYAGRKAIERGDAAQHYQEFKDFVSYGRGLKKDWKSAVNYYKRTLQFFFTGLLIKEDV